MLCGYKKYGREFFVHGNKGRKPATAIPDDTRRTIIELYRTKHYDANFRHFSELLEKHEQISVSPSCVSRILESEYILSPKVTKTKKNVSKNTCRTKRNIQKANRNLIPFRLIWSLSKMPTPDVRDVHILAKWNKWMQLPLNGSAVKYGTSI